MTILLARHLLTAALAVTLAGYTAYSSPQAPPTAAPYTVLSKQGRQPLAARTINGQEMFALDDLARIFELAVKEDALAGGLTVSVRNQTIVLSAGQGLASVGGRLISLPSPPAREGRAWFVPVDFVSRALGPALGTPLELRKPSRLILVGAFRMPRIAGKVEPLGSVTRLTLDIAPATPHSVTQEGTRLVIRFDADALDASLPTTTAPEFIQGIRPGDTPSTIAVDLGPRFGTYRVTDVPADRGTARLVIDILAPASEAQPPLPPVQDAPPMIDLAPPESLRTVVIDPGHGGAELGSRGVDGTLEKDLTLTIARRLKASLEARLGVRVILTRDGDQTVNLDQRAAVANNNKADIFLSLHANASVRAVASGAEIFYLSLDEYGDRATQIARGGSETLPVVGGGMRDIEVIPWEMAQVRYIAASAALAQSIEGSFKDRIPMSARAVQQAPFRVLVGANMPAVLVEMGFLTNRDQEKQLKSDTFQSTIVHALVDAVVQFRARSAPR